MNTFAKNLKKIRKKHNLSQEQLADELGLSRQAISKWESGVAYPEMEKIVQICQKFDVEIDMLLNKDMAEAQGEKAVKTSMAQMGANLLRAITDTMEMFGAMTAKSRVKCLFEQVVVLTMLGVVLMIFGSLLNAAGQTILQSIFPWEVGYRILQVFQGLYLIVAAVVGAMTVVHIFKMRYLEYFRESRTGQREARELGSSAAETSAAGVNVAAVSAVAQGKGAKIVIRDPQDSEGRIANVIFKVLVIIVKVGAVLMSVFLAGALILSFAMAVFSCVIAKTGWFFVGVLLSLVAVGVFCFAVLLTLVNFVFDRKSNKKWMVRTALAAVAVFGLGCGLASLATLDFAAVGDAHKVTRTTSLSMQPNLVIAGPSSVVYEEKEVEDVVLEYQMNEACMAQVLTTRDFSDSYRAAVLMSDCRDSFALMRQVLDGLNEKQIVTPDTGIWEIKVYASAENLKVLRANRAEYERRMMEEGWREGMVS